MQAAAADGTTGAIVARMDDGNDYRGWDLWLEGGRVGTHIVNKWPDDALKVVANDAAASRTSGTTCSSTYDGSGKAAGVKVYVNGAAAADGRRRPTRLKGTIRTDGAAQGRPAAHAGRGSTDVALQDLRLYGRALAGRRGRRSSPRPAARPSCSAKPADKRTAAETDELFAWWLAALDEPYAGAPARSSRRCEQEEAAHQGPRHRSPTSCRRRPRRPMAYILFRGEYDKRRDTVKAGTPAVAAAAAAGPAAGTASASRSGCCGPSTR